MSSQYFVTGANREKRKNGNEELNEKSSERNFWLWWLMSCFGFNFRRLESSRRWWSSRFRLLFLLAGIKIVPWIDALLTRLLEVFRKFFLSFFRFFFFDFLLTLPFSLFHVSHVELLTLPLHVSKKFHDHNIFWVLIFLWIVFGYWVAATFFLELFTFIGEQQVRSLLRLFVNIQTFFARNVVLENLPRSVYDLESGLRPFLVVLVFVRMYQYWKSLVFFLDFFDFCVMFKLQNFERIQVEVGWAGTEKSLNLLLTR